MTTDVIKEQEDMGTTEAVAEETTSEEEMEIHWLQKFYDNPWILLVLGILIPFISYTLWGWIDLASVAPAQLP